MRLRLLLLLPVLSLAACKGNNARLSDAGFEPNPTTGATPTEDDRYAIYSSEDAIKVGLTDDVLYYRLSDKLLARVDSEMQREATPQEGIGGTIERAVKSGVSKALRHRVEYPLARLDDVRYEDGQLTLVFTDGTTERPSAKVNVSEGDGGRRTSARPSFEAADATRFIAAFRDAKAGQTP